CGIASVMMVNFKMKKWQLAASVSTAPAGAAAFAGIGFNVASAIKLESQVYAAYAAVTGQPYDGSAYTDGYKLIEILNKLGIGKWAIEYYDGGGLPGKLMAFVGGPAAPAPAIVHVKWRSQGAHFIVCDTVIRSGAQTYADFCDPGDGSVRTVQLTRGTPIVYRSGSGAVGDMKGWVLYRKSA
ncbi:MAG: hypothetical protein ABIO39_10550, partial [Caulobacteraceae bacterium]